MNYILSFLSSIIFFIVKYCEIKFIKRQQVEFKILLRESLIVGLSTTISQFLFDQFEPLNTNLFKTPTVFVDDPKF